MLWWLDDFLSGRKQYTVVDNTASITCDIEEGVPQGAVLSPLLFLLMIMQAVMVWRVLQLYLQMTLQCGSVEQMKQLCNNN